MNLDQFPGVNAGYVFELYERYRQNPDSVDAATRKIFEGWTPAERGTAQTAGAQAPVTAATLQAAVATANLAESVRRYALAGHLDPTRGLQALEDLSDFPLTRYPHDLLLPRIWEMRHNITAYDAAYIALAEALDAPLITRDAALVSAGGHRAQIELI